MPSEKQLDQALDQAFKNSPAFCTWFLGQLKNTSAFTAYAWSNSKYPWGKVALILPNPETGALEAVAREGETDVLVVFESAAKRRLGVHIENKLAGGSFTAYQAEVYAARAQHWRQSEKHGNYDEWQTVLLAPRAFYERNKAEARKFTAFISHEDVAAQLSAFATPNAGA
jgi:hypothetical protein